MNITTRWNTDHPGRTKNNEPTLTDQAAARETDLNIIIRKLEVAGELPVPATPEQFGDISNLPFDFREMIHTARELAQIRQGLPAELREIDPAELLAMTPDQIRAKLQPPAPTPAPTPDKGTEEK